jgi:hypothetical protein
MNVLERALIEKAGREHGWENVVESRDERVVLASARHRGRVTISAGGIPGAWCIELPESRLTRELDRTLPGHAHSGGRFDAADMDTLCALLRRAAELAHSLPDQAARTFRERAATALATIAANGTEVERLVRQRVGQDVFREALLDYWGGSCAVTALALPEVLRASHAKPWADCTSDEERLDVFNGFLLVAHLDALFDRGLITFDEIGTLIISSSITALQRTQLNLNAAPQLRWLAPEHEPYLRWHREHCFR